MKKKFRSLVALILAFIMAVPMVVLGANELTESTARVFVDGAEVSTSTSLGGGIGRKPAFTVEGRTFLAARAMGVAFSRDIMWQPHSNTLYFGQVPAHSYLVTVTTPGGQQTISIDQIHALGMTNVDAISNNNPINFGAVSFASLFEAMNINVSNAQNFIFVGLDSFYNWATAEDVLNAENGWLALYENGTRLGTRTRVVLAADGAPGRWVRDIKEIIVVEGDIYEMWNREINIVADGVTVDKTNGGMPFMHRGKIYMPLRAVAEALGFPVGWNGAENAITIGTTDIASQVVGGGELAINAGGVQLIVTMDDVLEIGLEDFYAVIRGERRDYSGVSIARIMDFLNLDASSATGMVTFDTRDGAGTQGTVLEVFDPTNGFIAIAEGGVPLGHWEAGGRGPFMLVFAQDQFAQRFMRYLTVINIDMPAPAVRAFNDHPIIINGQTFTANDLYALGATDLEWNNQNFIALPVTALNLGNITGGRIVADNESYRDLDAAAAASLYIAIYRAGHEPQTDNHFTAVVTIDTNNQRRLGGLAIVELEIGDARTFNNHPLTINGQTFTANDIYALG
ncbi:MAG: copper amine oxidase N-terminal domain-containing protein, partial [Defluviitaleaceae bacterium]|nr:copper amine oxidase N-terminal domain-containing protein [Defluviitaleaceae bacterium]